LSTVIFLHSLIRKEEKLLLHELSAIDIDVIRWDTRSQFLNLKVMDEEADLVIERSISTSQGLNTVRYFETYGIPAVNSSEVISVCSDKLSTSLVLRRNSLPQPDVYIAHSAEGALQAVESLGYPVVLKPVVGSWGRLISRVNDRAAAEALIEHKSTLGNYMHSTFYVQDLIEKGGRDIRSFVVGDQVVAAIYRTSDHWITNTSRGGIASNCEVTDELEKLSLDAAQAVSGGSPAILAIDIFESPDGLLVNEINSTMEFRNSIQTTGVNIPRLIAEYLKELIRR